MLVAGPNNVLIAAHQFVIAASHRKVRNEPPHMVDIRECLALRIFDIKILLSSVRPIADIAVFEELSKTRLNLLAVDAQFIKLFDERILDREQIANGHLPGLLPQLRFLLFVKFAKRRVDGKLHRTLAEERRTEAVNGSHKGLITLIAGLQKAMAFCRHTAQFGVMATSCTKAKPAIVSWRSASSWPARTPAAGSSAVANSISRIVLRGPLLTPKVTIRGAPR